MMNARVAEIPLEELKLRAHKKIRQVQAETGKPEPDWHSLTHLLTDAAAAARGVNERLKKKRG